MNVEFVHSARREWLSDFQLEVLEALEAADWRATFQAVPNGQMVFVRLFWTAEAICLQQDENGCVRATGLVPAEEESLEGLIAILQRKLENKICSTVADMAETIGRTATVEFEEV